VWPEKLRKAMARKAVFRTGGQEVKLWTGRQAVEMTAFSRYGHFWSATSISSPNPLKVVAVSGGVGLFRRFFASGCQEDS
jgi:hypothetical protein